MRLKMFWNLVSRKMFNFYIFLLEKTLNSKKLIIEPRHVLHLHVQTQNLVYARYVEEFVLVQHQVLQLLIVCDYLIDHNKIIFSMFFRQFAVLGLEFKVVSVELAFLEVFDPIFNVKAQPTSKHVIDNILE
jgi:hypothetical protein